MVNITHKSNSLRQAIATAQVLVSKQETIDAVREKKVPKGDVFEFSRAAGLLAIKKTSDTIPDCHPLPVEYAAISYSIEGLRILINVEVHTIYKTGVEVEAMHGAAITALTIYDMLKPIDKNVEISSIKLKEKKGGKTDLKLETDHGLKSAVIVCSDTVAAGNGEDKSGKVIIAKLEKLGIAIDTYKIIPDEIPQIQAIATKLSEANIQIAIFTGGTGLSPRDNTPDALQPLIEKEIPGIMETARSYGQQRSPYAMLSRGIAGFIKNTLVVTVPGSVKGAEETMDALFPQVLHLFQVKKGVRHS
jgi:molybdenum cofactor biosynthesis protein MoaC